jgi:predicted  nucleic acid-binding Zn-ribbon protein
MNDESNNIILTHLRGIRDDLSDVKNRLSGLEASLATVLQHQGHLAGQVAQVQVGIDRQSTRIGRIEERLGLIDSAAS